MKVLRVFPQKTSYTPDDDMVLIGYPPQVLPEHDEIHISCTFSWDKEFCEFLKTLYQKKTNKKVLIGGVAYGSKADDFIQGMYIKQNIIFTSRGCNNNCKFCGVPKREGKLKPLKICDGNIIQDNNFLQCPKSHKEEVFSMLKNQKGIKFKGGLQASLIDNHFLYGIEKLKMSELWLACDRPETIPSMKRAAKKLKEAGYNQNKLNCYVLGGDDMEENENRCREVYNAGMMPFLQLYQPNDCLRKTTYPKHWKDFQRMWSRPAATEAHMKKSTEFFVSCNSKITKINKNKELSGQTSIFDE